MIDKSEGDKDKTICSHEKKKEYPETLVASLNPIICIK